MPALVGEGDFLYTTDDTSRQLAVAPEHDTFWGFHWKGVYYAFIHMPFGVASTCYVYTHIKAELYMPFRQAGVMMAFLINDRLGAAHGKEQAKRECRITTAIVVCLGGTLSLKKSQFMPTTRAVFLGMEVDATEQQRR